MNILSDHGEENVSPACRHGSDDAENIATVHEGTDLYSNATACRVDDDVYNLCPELFDFRSRFKFNFIFSHINLNSFRYKYSFIRDILIKQSVDYFAISESKLDDSFTNAQFHIPDFVCYRQDLTSSSGGLLIYVRADLPHRRLNHIEINYNGFESLCTEITIGNTKTVLCCVYKHPKVTNHFFKQCMSKLGDAILHTYDDFVFLGDMNCCPIKSNVIKDLCDLYDVKNLLKDPTCHKGATSTLLDNILVSNHRRYTGALNANFNLSDCHNLIGAATRRYAPIMKPRKIFCRSYKHFCEADYLTDPSFAPFHVADIFDDIDDIAWFSFSLIRNVIDAHAPVKSQIITKQSVPYMNSKLQKAQYARNMARNKFQQSGKAYWEENRRHRNDVAKIKKSSMRIYFEKNCKKHDKQFWRTISPFMSDKKFRNGGNIILNENGETKTDAAEVSDIFNDFFISAGVWNWSQWRHCLCASGYRWVCRSPKRHDDKASLR